MFLIQVYLDSNFCPVLEIVGLQLPAEYIRDSLYALELPFVGMLMYLEPKLFFFI
jgi:hypothetical protein